MYKLLTIDKIKPGTIIIDRKSNKFLIIGLKNELYFFILILDSSNSFGCLLYNFFKFNNDFSLLY